MKKAQALMLECVELFIFIYSIVRLSIILYFALDLVVSTPWAFHTAYDRANTAGLPIEHFSLQLFEAAERVLQFDFYTAGGLT